VKAGPTRDAVTGNGGPASDGRITPPSIQLPKGGGAIRGIGEKLTANLVSGTSATMIPIPEETSDSKRR